MILKTQVLVSGKNRSKMDRYERLVAFLKQTRGDLQQQSMITFKKSCYQNAIWLEDTEEMGDDNIQKGVQIMTIIDIIIDDSFNQSKDIVIIYEVLVFKSYNTLIQTIIPSSTILDKPYSTSEIQPICIFFATNKVQTFHFIQIHNKQVSKTICQDFKPSNIKFNYQFRIYKFKTDMTTQEHFINFAKKAEGVKGQTLFNHVSSLIQASTNDKNKLNGIKDLELLSTHIKNTHFTYVEPPLDTQLKNMKPKRGLFMDYFQKVNEINEKAHKTVAKQVILPNYVADFQALKLAGISIGQFNNKLIYSIMRGMCSKNIVSLRFWGKILGLKDYFVIQGLTSKKVKDDISADTQPQGQGVNYYSYWVTTNILSDWIQLPLIKPQHVRAAKQIKYIFTGDLDRSIDKYPVFQGKEKHLLKAQIVRITHSCEVAPKGLYKLNDQKPEYIDFQDEFKLPQIADMMSPDNWVHLNQNVNSQGRCSFYINPLLSEEQKENLQAEVEKQTVERLKSISQDTPLQTLGMTTAWSTQQLGETQVISALGQTGSPTSYSIVLLKNLNWPGAYAVGHSKGWVNIYIGYGHKLLQSSFTPISPKDIAIQGQDKQEFAEPFPLEAPPPPVIQNTQNASQEKPNQQEEQES